MAAPSIFVGIAGNFISMLVFASPIATFWRIVKKKSTLNYEGLPYVITLLNTSLWTYYGILKPGGLLVLTVNGAGSVMQGVYVLLFLIFAPTKARIKIAKLAGGLNIGMLGAVFLVTLLVFHGSLRLLITGCLCAALTVGMYAAPLAAMRLVVQTQSVEFMPFSLSFFLFLNGGIWSVYAFLVKDFYIGIPNAIGFILGTAQLILYSMYRNRKPTPTISKQASADLEARAPAGVAVGQLELAAGEQQKGLQEVSSLPLKKTSLYGQTSLTMIVKSLSLPPCGNSNWSLDELGKGETY